MRVLPRTTRLAAGAKQAGHPRQTEALRTDGFVSQTFRLAGGIPCLAPFMFPDVDERSHWESAWTGRDASSVSWYQSTAAT